jgi:dethiobiotin synthetase
MVQKLFITATNTDIGKTYAATALLEALGRRGIAIGAVKPVETGVSNIPQDAQKLLNICKKYNKKFQNLEPKDICAYTFALPAAPFSADTQKSIEIATISIKIAQIEKLCDFLIIEGAGGLYVPITKDYFMIDLIQELQVPTLLVTPSHLGCINETLLSIRALEERALEYRWCVNLHKNRDDFIKTTKPFYDAKFNKWQTLQEFIEEFTI